MTELAKVRKALQVAEDAAKQASSAHGSAVSRITTTETEIVALTEQVRAADPDDADALGKLVGARDAARGRLEALQARAAAAAQAVEAAAARLAEAKVAAAKVEFGEVAARLERDDLEIIELVKRFEAEFLERVKAHQELARSEETRALRELAGGELPDTVSNRVNLSGSYGFYGVWGERGGRLIRDHLHRLEMNAEWSAADGPRLQEEQLKRDAERTAQRLAEETWDGDVKDMPGARVHQAITEED